MNSVVIIQRQGKVKEMSAPAAAHGLNRVVDVSGVASMDEGLEEMLTLHCLGLVPILGVSLFGIKPHSSHFL
ncbi:MAG: hypothetical protein ABIU05_21270 [Nitrospirales bacterium]